MSCTPPTTLRVGKHRDERAWLRVALGASLALPGPPLAGLDEVDSSCGNVSRLPLALAHVKLNWHNESGRTRSHAAGAVISLSTSHSIAGIWFLTGSRHVDVVYEQRARMRSPTVTSLVNPFSWTVFVCTSANLPFHLDIICHRIRVSRSRLFFTTPFPVAISAGIQQAWV